MNVTAEGLDDDTNAINFIRDVVIGAHYRDLLIGVVHVAVFQRNGRMASLCRGLTTIFEQDGEETACAIKVADADPAQACRHEVLEGIEMFHADVPDARAHILFIHGVVGDGWQWRENFLPYFAQHGFGGSALSLRGHGGSESRENIALRGYEEDVHSLLRHLTN